jgi:ABC-2 type transport system permease protein
MAILFVFLGAQFGVTSLLTEKRTGTLARLVAAPIKPTSILLGKTLVSMALAIVSMTVIILGTAILLGARWGDPFALGMLVLAAALAATGIALLAVGFAKTEDQAGSLVAIVTITLAVLGGSFFPAAQGPGIMAQLSKLTPHHWFLRGVDDISTGGDVASASTSIAILAVIGLVTGSIGLWRARRVVVA